VTDEPVGRWRWLETTRDLQRDAYGWDWDVIRANGEQWYVEQLRGSINVNVTAATAELGEFLQELGPIWKQWADLPDRLDQDARDRAVGELVDVVHFIANVAIALGVTDDEWETRYAAKQEKNRQRQAAGYDGISSKCPGCKRDLSEAGVNTSVGDDKTYLECAACGTTLDQPRTSTVTPVAFVPQRCPRCDASYADGTACLPSRTEVVSGHQLRPYCATVGHYV